MDDFLRLCNLAWKEVFRDPCTGDWHTRWTLDGLKATVMNSPLGMDFMAGPDRKDDASHAVLWTRESFAGDIRIEYEYTKLDTVIEAVTILYIQATGSGIGDYAADISKWADQREVPAMAHYFNHMHLYHISCAAFGIGNTDSENDYIRARRYMPESPDGLEHTHFTPEFYRTGFFKPEVPHTITVIKKGAELFIHIRNKQKDQLCRWNTSTFPPIREGRIGLRHMWTRAARYRNFRIYQINT